MTDDKIVEAMARAIRDADINYSIRLTSLSGDVSTYSLEMDGSPCALEFSSRANAALYADQKRAEVKARAALSVARPMIEAEARRSNIAVKTGPGAILTEDGRAWIPRHKIRES